MRQQNEPPAPDRQEAQRGPHPSAPRPRRPRSGGTRRTLAEVRRVTLRGRSIPYRITISERARRLRLVIRQETGLEVILPCGVPLTAHEAFLHEKEAWILATLDRLERQTSAAAPQPLVSGRSLSFAGRKLTLEVRAGAPSGRFRVALAGDVLTLTLPVADDETARRALEIWFRKQAPVVFAERLGMYNARYGYRYGRVSIKEQKSRWGSCSRLGNLNFNWRLLLAPLSVLDYVVVHELCHLKEMNHSARFWQLVASTCPDYMAQRRWLRQHGHELRI
jgi:predicted metal-dependent hydrolase